MLLFPFSLNQLCGALVTTSRNTIDAYVLVFNLLDPFKLARASHRLQQNFLQVALH